MSEKTPDNNEKLSKTLLALTAGLGIAQSAYENEFDKKPAYTEESKSAKYSPEVDEAIDSTHTKFKIVEQSQDNNSDVSMSKYLALKDDPKEMAEAMERDHPDTLAVIESKLPGITDYIKTEHPELIKKAGLDLGPLLKLIPEAAWGYAETLGLVGTILLGIGLWFKPPRKVIGAVTKGALWTWPRHKIDSLNTHDAAIPIPKTSLAIPVSADGQKTALKWVHAIALTLGTVGGGVLLNRIDNTTDQGIDTSSAQEREQDISEQTEREIKKANEEKASEKTRDANDADKRLRERYSN